MGRKSPRGSRRQSPEDLLYKVQLAEKQREERRRLYLDFVRSIAALPAIEKAERWLQYQAENLEQIEDLEAVVYLASRGRDVLRLTQAVRDLWADLASMVLRQAAQRSQGPDAPPAPGRRIPAIADFEAVEGASEYLLPNFWRVPNGHEFIGDAVMLRTAGACGLSEYMPWFRRLVRIHREAVLKDGIEPVPASLALLSLVRSDLARELMGDVLLRLLESLELPESPSLSPWQITSRVLAPGQRQFRTVDRIDYATTIALASLLLRGHSQEPLTKKAIGFVLASQDSSSGSWRIAQDWASGSIETTAAAVHLLCMTRPAGWKSATKKAAAWLLREQNSDGYWGEESSPYPVYLTVFVLDALALASGERQLTFTPVVKPGPQTISVRSIESPPSERPAEDEIPQISEAAPRSSLDRPDLLLVVATHRELVEALKVIKPLKGKRRILRASRANLTYYFGRIGSFHCSLILSGMGSGGLRGSQNSIDLALSQLRPRAVVGVGIAFGANSKKQDFADVLVSSKVAMYEPARQGESTIRRGAIPDASSLLVDRFSNFQGWKYSRHDGGQPRVHIGLVLSGEKLVDEPGFKAQLLSDFPEAIGGEMEGAGVYAACESGPDKYPWIVVKGIADWADGNKTSVHQSDAAAAALSLAAHVFRRPTALDGLKKPRGKVRL